jgi:hypothetical protein
VKRIGKGYCPLLLLHLIVLRTGMLQQRPQQVGRRDIKDAEGAFEDLHVYITADTIEKVEAAVALIEPLLTPVDEDRNTHKRKQLRELAEMNGKVDCSLPLASLTS